MRPFPQEQLLIDQLEGVSAEKILCTSLGLAQLAHAAARQFGGARVYCHYLDLHHAEQALRSVQDRPENLSIGCAADFPEGEFDFVALPFSARGEAELTRDLMQAGHQTLKVGGRMAVSTDNPQDKWLHEQMVKLFGQVVRRNADSGAVYLARKKEPLKKVKNFGAEFVFRDGNRLIRAYSRPGVFSHRRIDPGARQLMNAMEITPGSRILDIGCGAGVLSLAAAFRAEVQVTAVDSNARAIKCTQKAAAMNGLQNINTILNASGDYEGRGTFDLVLANPPYYAAFQIAKLFVLSGRAALRLGGRIMIVTKSPQWYAENMPDWFGSVDIERSKEYHIVTARTAARE